MPSPTTTDQLLANIQRSGLIAPEELATVLADTPDDGPLAVLERLQTAGMLTKFQAGRIRAGKYKGFILGDYVILDQLGGGGTGQVYLAEHAVMHRLVALKVLSIGASVDPVARERFFREARATAVLDHPNIIRVFDLRRESTVFYLVMEFISGISLQHVVSRHGAQPWQLAAAYIRQVALGLIHAHEHGYIHRDIKPANLLLARDGTVKILDLGLVREVEGESKLTEQVDRTILGTADYLAPEQAVDSSKVDVRADIYSLGATFYYLLAGHTMFRDGRTAQKLMWQQLSAPTPIRELKPDVPPGLAVVLHAMLEKKPADRPQTPADVAKLLEPWTREPVDVPNPKWMPALPNRRGLTGASTHVPVSTDSQLRSNSTFNLNLPGRSQTRLAKYSTPFLELPPVPEVAHDYDMPTMEDRSAQTPRTLGTKPETKLPTKTHLPVITRASIAPVPRAPLHKGWKVIVVAVAIAAILGAAAAAIALHFMR